MRTAVCYKKKVAEHCTKTPVSQVFSKQTNKQKTKSHLNFLLTCFKTASTGWVLNQSDSGVTSESTVCPSEITILTRKAMTH